MQAVSLKLLYVSSPISHTKQIKSKHVIENIQQAICHYTTDTGIGYFVKHEVKEVRKFRVAKQRLPMYPQLGKALKLGQNHFCCRSLRDILAGHHSVLALRFSASQISSGRSTLLSCWPLSHEDRGENAAGGTVVSRFWWELQ